MIEIPDLDDLSTTTPSDILREYQNSEATGSFVGEPEDEPSPVEDLEEQPDYTMVSDPDAYQTLSHLSINDDEETEGLDAHRFRQFQFHSKSPAENAGPSPLLEHQDLTIPPVTASKASLALTDVSYETRSQVVELDTAQTLSVQQHISAPNSPENTLQFKLQDPPVIRERRQYDREFYDQESADIVNDIMPSPTVMQQFASPLSHMSSADHMKPSPQLPPPASSYSSQRLTLSNGEEFMSLRKGLATDLKSPAEYTLHIVFTQFVRHAERKLNLCLEYPIQEEPPVIELLAEGSGDVEFDKIIVSLGYIARRKPKPVIDSVMFWRKSKSETASLAAAEVERILQSAKSDLAKMAPISPANPGIVKNGNSNVKSKRSLSLMRSKSISKMTSREHRRNQSTSSVLPDHSKAGADLSSGYSKQKAIFDEQFNQAREAAIQAERKSLASIYILCRVLVEVVKQTPSDVMGDDLGGKLEEIVYTQLKTTDPISTSESLIRSANWNLFAELLGFMSEKRFLSVSDRFIADLEKVPREIDQEDEPRLHLLIHGMRYLKLTNYPLDVFEESAEFIESLGKFFSKAHNESMILAYCEVLSNLLLPLANVLTAETNHPTWSAAIEKIFQKAFYIWNRVNGNFGSSSGSSNGNSNLINISPGSVKQMSSISGAWECSLNLLTASLAVSRKELFSNTWFEIIEESMHKLKPKVETEDKTTLITCIARMTWVYMFRLTDTLNNTVKRLDSLFQLLFFSSSATNKKQQWLVSDKYLIASLVELIRIVGYKHLNYTLDNVLISLMKISFNGNSLENLVPEKVILCVKSYLAILKDYEVGKKPVFPTDDEISDSISVKPSSKSAEKQKITTVDDSEFNFIAKNSDNASAHEELCKNFGVLLRLLDQQYGCNAWSKDIAQSTPVSNKSQSPFSAFHFGIDLAYQTSKNLQMELFATLIDASPWLMSPLAGDKISPSGLYFKTVVELLTRNSVHSNFRIADASIKALKKLASRKNPSTMVNIFAKFAFQFTDKPNSNYDPNYLTSNEFNRLLKLYVELLNCWLQHFKQLSIKAENQLNPHPLSQDDELMSKDVLNDLYQINYKNDDILGSQTTPKMSTGDELGWKTVITSIEEIEGNGLFFLCASEAKIRHYGISILKIVEQFDQEIYNATDTVKIVPNESNSSRSHSRTSSKFAADIGTRLIHVLETADFLELSKSFRGEMSLPERNRVSKLKFKKNVIVRIAESDYGIDSTLWFRVYPKLLEIFFEKCPMPIAICRSIVCVRLVQMHEQIFEISESYRNITSSFFTKNNGIPPEVLVNQWKLYLIFASCSLTSTNDQKISFPSQPTHGRKKSLQMFIQHQTITSAKSVFRMVLPFLKSNSSIVKDAVIAGLSCININIFKTFLENIQVTLSEWDDQTTKRDSAEDSLRIEIINILSRVTTRFKSHRYIYTDEWVVANLVSIIKSLKAFLTVSSIQTSVEFQKLRRFFCTFLENVFIGLQDKAVLNRWLPFEARIGCFNFLKEWCGIGETKALTEERYNAMLSKFSHSKDVTAAVATLEVERKVLQLATLSCMATICSGSITQEINIPGSLAVMSFDIPGLMKWIRNLLSSEDETVHEIGRRALENILKNNPDNDDIYQEVSKQCYVSQTHPKTTQSYFTTFVTFLIEHKKFETPPTDLFGLVSFLIGDDNHEVRVYSMRLLKYLEFKFHNTKSVEVFTEGVTSKTKVVYKKALFEISAHLASIHPEYAFYKISYLTMCFSLVNTTTRSNILTCLLPWVQTVELTSKVIPNSESTVATDSKLGKSSDLEPASIMVLNNLFEITVRFSSIMVNEVEALWVALANKANNFDKIVDYLISNSLERKNVAFVSYSKQIIDYLTFSQPDVHYMVEKLISHLVPKAMIPPKPQALSLVTTPPEADCLYVANLQDLLPANDKDSSFSLGQLSLILLVDLFCSRNDRMIDHLPLILHVSFSLLDHYMPMVQEAAWTILAHLLRALAPEDPKTDMAVLKLQNKDHHKTLWVYDDLNNDKRGARTPKNMDSLVRNVLEILTPVAPTLQDDWSRVALNWATTCAVRHIACRSFQIFRGLLSFLDQGMLKDMLHRLSNTISDETPDIQGFAMQILMTLNAVSAELDSEKLIDFPQLFWSGVACLSTIHEQEFIEVLSAMSKFVSKIDLDSPETVSCLISTFPPKWEGRFEGLQQVVMVGLRSATSYDQTMKFLDKLTHLKDSEIIGQGDSRLLMTIVANLPRFLHALDERKINKEIEETAMVLSNMTEAAGKQSLAKIFVSLARNRFRSKKDFLVQTITSIRNVFFPEYEAQVLVMLLGFLSNKAPWVKIETLSILKHVFPLIDLQRDEFVGVGADLISPLLRLLLTDYAEAALEVLDEAVSISGSQLDKDVLRMSLGNSAMKKEYERTATLFGIPDDSGWAIPMPAVTASSTRNNVHAVFSTCAVATVVEDEQIEPGEEFHFHREDYYVPPQLDNISVNVEERDASLSHMWAALDDFDSFFTKEHDRMPNALLQHRNRPTFHGHSASVDTRNSNTSEAITPLDSVPFVYDKKASVILNRSLARTQSNTSFKTSLADSIGNHAYGSPSANSKKSFIPFRNRHAVKKNTFATPTMPLSPTFDAQGNNLISSPLSVNSTLRSPTFDPSESKEGFDSTMFDSFLGGPGKRKTRKATKAPTTPTSHNFSGSLNGGSPAANGGIRKDKRKATPKR